MQLWKQEMTRCVVEDVRRRESSGRGQGEVVSTAPLRGQHFPRRHPSTVADQGTARDLPV